METIDEKPLVHDAKTGGAEGVTTEKLAPNESQIQTRTPGERLKDTGKKVLGDIKQAGKTAVEKTKDWYSGVKDKYNNAENTYEDPYLQRPDVNYRTSTVPTDKEERANQDIMRERLAETDDLIQRGAETGAEASAALQNVKVPKSKLSSYQDIMNSEEYKGQRIPYMANAIGTNLANLLSGKDYKSYLKSHNEQMADTYAKNKAAVDTAATNANIQDIEAGNKAEMGKYVQMSDAMVEAALKRYGLLEDTENKRQMLESIINDATGKEGVKWGNLDADEKIAVMSLLQAYNGDYSMMSLAMEKYGDKFFDIIDQIGQKLGTLLGMNKNNGGDGEPTEPVENDNVIIRDSKGTKTMSKKDFASVSDGYTEIPQANGEPIVVRSFHGQTWDPEDKEFVVNAIMNSDLPYEEKLAKARHADGYRTDENGASRFFTDDKLHTIEKEVKARLDAEQAQNDLFTKIGNNYNNLSALKTMEKEVQNSKDPKIQKYYNQAVGAATVRKEMNDWKQDSSLTTSEKITLLESLPDSEYGTYIANDPSLQDYIAQELQGYKIRKNYNDPLLDRTNDRLALKTGNGKGKSWKLKANGNIAFGNKEYDLSSAEKTKDIKKDSWRAIIRNLLTNTPDYILDQYNANSPYSLTRKDAKEYFTQSSEYAAIQKLLDNQLVKAYADESSSSGNTGFYDDYVLLAQLYDKWSE